MGDSTASAAAAAAEDSASPVGETEDSTSTMGRAAFATSADIAARRLSHSFCVSLSQTGLHTPRALFLSFSFTSLSLLRPLSWKLVTVLLDRCREDSPAAFSYVFVVVVVCQWEKGKEKEKEKGAGSPGPL